MISRRQEAHGKGELKGNTKKENRRKVDHVL